jgi:uncharacterized Fe-S cluster-containing radical SAM superfamily protein
MSIQRERLYRFPWSRTDNPGGWIEVTDECDLACPACYRSTLEGHVPVEEIKSDILKLKKHLNCDCIAIAGGEPLLYPDIVDVVEFITKNDLKSRILTNGQNLTWDLAKNLKNAGLTGISFHVDSKQSRLEWEGKTEAEMNELRQQYTDLIWELGDVHCGFLATVYRSTLQDIPDILDWSRKNLHKVRSMALITLRGIPLSDDLEYYANSAKVDPSHVRSSFEDPHEIDISAEEIFEVIEERFPGSHPSAYLNGTSDAESYKVLIIPYLGSKHGVLGNVGCRTIEFSQTMYHFFKGRYNLGVRKMDAGRRVFLLSLLDPEVRKSFSKYMRSVIRNPGRLFSKIYVQTIQIQQPKEILNGENNLCDGCLNQMVYKDEIINSCRLDEYRLYGGPLIPMKSPRGRGRISTFP